MARPPANLTRGRPGPVHGQARSGAPGANDFRCRPGTVNCPSSSFPGPGRTPTRNGRAGLCAYTFPDNPLVVDGHPVEWAVFSGDIRHSSKTLDSVVDRVLAATGAPAVNLVGYSQGSGPLPHHYIRELGGDRVVEQLIGTGASNHGPRAHSAADRFDVHPEMRHGYSRNAGKTNALAWEQQISGSMLLNELTIGDITRPGVRYTFLGTRHDNAVLPH